ncbi:hypothetical protein Tco_0099669 [Tanacetum coccineum]
MRGLGPTFEVAVQRAVDALLPGLTTRLTIEIRQNSAGGSGDQPPTIHTWLESFEKQKPRSFRSATTPVDAANWIAHIENVFEVLGFANEFKARLASYKLEGDALNWWKAFKQAKGGETYVATLHGRIFVTSSFYSTFLGFWWKRNFTDVDQVANAARNMEILCERSSQNNKRNRDGERIRPTTQDSNQMGYDQKGYDGRSYDRQGGNSNQKSWQNRGQQYNRSSGSSGQKRYPDYASSPPYDICGKLYPGKACHRVTGACFICGSNVHIGRDCLEWWETVVGDNGDKTTINCCIGFFGILVLMILSILDSLRFGEEGVDLCILSSLTCVYGYGFVLPGAYGCILGNKRKLRDLSVDE